MTITEFRDLLMDAIYEADDDIVGTATFASAGLLTRNEGVVVRFVDGTEFQVTIVKSAESTDA